MTRTQKTHANRATAGERVYRYNQASWFIGVTGLVVWPLLAAVGIGLCLLNPDGSIGQPVLSAAAYGSCFLGFALLSFYLLVAYYRTQLSTADANIRYDGVFRSKTIPLTDITRAVWRSWPRGGSLVLHAPDNRLAVEFGPYAHARELAAYFRTTLPAEIQERYERFAPPNPPSGTAVNRSVG